MKNKNFISLTAVGDVCFSGKVEDVFLKNNRDPFENVKEVLNNSDILFCNLESPLTNSNDKQKKHYSKILNSTKSTHLKSNPNFSKNLKNSNFSLISLANNHILDYNEKGLFDTIEALKKENIQFIGAGKNINEARKAYFLEKNGIKLGFLAYSYTYEATHGAAGAAPLWKNIIIEDILKIKHKVDHIIISLHFGSEFSKLPTSSERNFAHLLIDKGATLILGHHPHVLREVEQYKNGIIVYSLGNFLFDPSIAKIGNEILYNVRRSVISKFKIFNDKILIDSMYPICLSKDGVPAIGSGKAKFVIINKLNERSFSNCHKLPFKDTYYNYLQKLIVSLRLIFASIITLEFRNIYLIYKRYQNLI